MVIEKHFKTDTLNGIIVLRQILIKLMVSLLSKEKSILQIT